LSERQRKIIHCDCDCFYAAVETRDDPSLIGKPVAVGGRPDQRGVVATCNYEARKFGIHSAMAMAQAIKRCPDLVVIRPNMEKYRVASRAILAIYRDYTDLVEPLSLDEAFLDVTNATHHQGSGTLIAEEIRARIKATVGITASAGVAPNKFLAKIASDWNKPDGLFVIRPHQIDDFVAALPVKKIFGVGKVTAAKLQKLGATTCADLRDWPPADLQHHFGKFGERLYRLCRGIDNREVCPDREYKSISVEETYVIDLPDLDACLRELASLVTLLVQRVKKQGLERFVNKLYVKMRFSDFRQTTVECVGTDIELALFEKLVDTGYHRRALPVRLLGAGVRFGEETDAPGAQLALFDGESTTSSIGDDSAT
jgi:DNA polymerase-4